MDKYTWQEVGSSFLPGEMVAAFLWAQLQEARRITDERLAVWNQYHALLEPLEARGLLRRPIIPTGCLHNAHMYYVLINPALERQKILASLKSAGVGATFHYVPLHDAPAGRRLARAAGDLEVTKDISSRLIRLPMWVGLQREDLEKVTGALTAALMS